MYRKVHAYFIHNSFLARSQMTENPQKSLPIPFTLNLLQPKS